MPAGHLPVYSLFSVEPVQVSHRLIRVTELGIYSDETGGAGGTGGIDLKGRDVVDRRKVDERMDWERGGHTFLVGVSRWSFELAERGKEKSSQTDPTRPSDFLTQPYWTLPHILLEAPTKEWQLLFGDTCGLDGYRMADSEIDGPMMSGYV
jgi:hypothetical protein